MLLSIEATIAGPADSDQPLLNSRLINRVNLNPPEPENSGTGLGRPMLFQSLNR